MLAQILPGFREIRGPLASGFLWLLFGYLIFHGDVAHAHGKVKEIEELGQKLNPAALATVAAFVAYLIGSLSEDLFKRALKRMAQAAATQGPERRPLLDENFSAEAIDDMSESFREAQVTRLENESDRHNAEGDLRVAILPPLVALIVYLAVDERSLWLVGLIFTAGLALQVWLRTQDYLIASSSLFAMRRVAGVPPASAEEAKAAEPAEPTPRIGLEAAEFARKGTELLTAGWDREEPKDWADQASQFLRDHAPDDAVDFLTVHGENQTQTLELQVDALRDIARRRR
jgi:hypothetical protein